MSRNYLTCPKCRRQQYFVCSNKECVCWENVPKGKKPQQFNADGETISCPYCGFTAHSDYWETREMKMALGRKGGRAMKMKKIALKPFKIFYDPQVKMWVSRDLATGIASQGKTKKQAYDNLIEALRLAILTYQDIEEKKTLSKPSRAKARSFQFQKEER